MVTRDLIERFVRHRTKIEYSDWVRLRTNAAGRAAVHERKLRDHSQPVRAVPLYVVMLATKTAPRASGLSLYRDHTNGIAYATVNEKEAERWDTEHITLAHRYYKYTSMRPILPPTGRHGKHSRKGATAVAPFIINESGNAEIACAPIGLFDSFKNPRPGLPKEKCDPSIETKAVLIPGSDSPETFEEVRAYVEAYCDDAGWFWFGKRVTVRPVTLDEWSWPHDQDVIGDFILDVE
jgi:hypothetical protein